jgi:hypothetical protein
LRKILLVLFACIETCVSKLLLWKSCCQWEQVRTPNQTM